MSGTKQLAGGYSLQFSAMPTSACWKGLCAPFAYVIADANREVVISGRWHLCDAPEGTDWQDDLIRHLVKGLTERRERHANPRAPCDTCDAGMETLCDAQHRFAAAQVAP